MEKINKSFIILLLLVLICFTCEKGLEPVEGIQGVVSFPVDSISRAVIFPDSAAFVVVAEFAIYDTITDFLANIVSYSDPLDIQKDSPYFIQLPSGFYLAGVVSMDRPIAKIYLLSGDSLKAHPEYFKPIGIYKLPGSEVNSFMVKDDEITENIDIDIDYNLALPF